ncbi:hypothetical protein HK405_013423, partial [Cladochytrium tenue]
HPTNYISTTRSKSRAKLYAKSNLLDGYDTIARIDRRKIPADRQVDLTSESRRRRYLGSRGDDTGYFDENGRVVPMLSSHEQVGNRAHQWSEQDREVLIRGPIRRKDCFTLTDYDRLRRRSGSSASCASPKASKNAGKSGKSGASKSAGKRGAAKSGGKSGRRSNTSAASKRGARGKAGSTESARRGKRGSGATVTTPRASGKRGMGKVGGRAAKRGGSGSGTDNAASASKRGAKMRGVGGAKAGTGRAATGDEPVSGRRRQSSAPRRSPQASAPKGKKAADSSGAHEATVGKTQSRSLRAGGSTGAATPKRKK